MPVVNLSGPIDFQSVPAVRRRLLDGIHGGDLQIDLSNVTNLDGSGLAALVETFQAAHEAGHVVRLTHPSREVLKMVSLARLEEVFGLGSDCFKHTSGPRENLEHRPTV